MSALHRCRQPKDPERETERLRQELAEKLEQCQHCGHALATQIAEVQTVGAVQLHQVTELPPIQARDHRISAPSRDMSGVWREHAGCA